MPSPPPHGMRSGIYTLISVLSYMTFTRTASEKDTYKQALSCKSICFHGSLPSDSVQISIHLWELYMPDGANPHNSHPNGDTLHTCPRIAHMPAHCTHARALHTCQHIPSNRQVACPAHPRHPHITSAFRFRCRNRNADQSYFLYYLFTRAPAPLMIASTSFLLAMVVSPGVVMARAP